MKKLRELKVESFATTLRPVEFLPDETWNDATAGCCSKCPLVETSDNICTEA